MKDWIKKSEIKRKSHFIISDIVMQLYNLQMEQTYILFPNY